jgi:2-oxoglutarate dehydrogenase E1 component
MTATLPLDDTSALNLGFVEDLWNRFQADPQSVSPQWKAYFERLDGNGAGRSLRLDVGKAQLAMGHGPGKEKCVDCGRAGAMAVFQHRVSELIRNYRVRGHRAAKLDPLSGTQVQLPELSPDFYGFTPDDMNLEFEAGELSANGAPMRLGDIAQALRQAYCGPIGLQFMHIDGLEERTFLIERMERPSHRKPIGVAQQRRILSRLTDAFTFERFVQTKFVGAKSFSLEGAESLIPLLDMAVEKAGEQGVEDIVMGMPHRGRLNVLANIMGKPARKIFGEFKDSDAQQLIGRGDVKYHLGYHRDWLTEAGKPVHLDLCFNPSHLEFVNPVALGLMRAKQDRRGDAQRSKGLVVLMHGDAAFAGEGIVQESLNLSELKAYDVGGALHIVVNNQVGFTTTAEQSRSSVYCTDVAKLLQIPIFHVNGENPEAVSTALDIAMDFRKRFRRDVVIDMYCYRRRGHNEGDEPTFTQPLMYAAIKAQRSVRQAYLDHMLALGGISRDEALAISEQSHRRLEQEFEKIGLDEPAASTEHQSRRQLGQLWERYGSGQDSDTKEAQTAVDLGVLEKTLDALCRVPQGFRVHPKLEKLLDARAQMKSHRPLDWGTAEALALATLSLQGVRVRLTGQDSQRGTFSHRHAVLHDMKNDARYMPLSNLGVDAAPVEIHNSPLSEGAVLGFEYGYSLAWPDGLILWEAQFGDFANAAQVYIDQFIASGETKWKRRSGLVLLLPHGLEGTGPEHASARLERFLMLCATDNLQVMNLTTPAQYFHALRRQVLRPIRKPMILMAPKSLLRATEATSPLVDLAQGRFERILADDSADPAKVRRVLLCSGKIYYDLASHRQKRQANDVAIVRLEQLYPMQFEDLAAVLAPYAANTPVFFVQEEPSNMGALPYFLLKLAPKLQERHPVRGVARAESSSPATGSHASHDLEQHMILEEAFEI